MSFAINVITSAGENLIAQATAANPIVLVKGLGCNTAASSASDLASKPISWYSFNSGNPDGVVFSASATGNVCRVILSFNNVDMNHTDSEPLKSACVLARLQSQTDADAVIIAAVSDSNSGATIPAKTSSTVNVNVPINITINSANQVETVSGQSASIADLDRFVSTHIAGNPSVGENQTIKGNKTFDGSSTFNESVLFDNTVQCESSVSITGNLFAQDAVVGNCMPNVDGNGAIGDGSHPFLAMGSINTYAAYVIPITGNLGSLGQQNKRFGYVYVNNVSTTNIKIPYGQDTFTINVQNGKFHFDTGLMPVNGGSQDIGDAAKMWRQLYIQQIELSPNSDINIGEDDGDIILNPRSGSAVYCGWPGALRNLYADKLNGCLESLSNPQTKVGSLAEVELTNITDSTTITLLRGSIMTTGDVVVGKTITVNLDGEPTSGQGWAILNKTSVSSQGTKVMALRVR